MPDIQIDPNDGSIQITATGGETELDFDFPIYEKAHLKIIRTRSGTLTELVLDTDYTIADDQLEVEAGGTAVLLSAAIAADVYTLLLNVPAERTSDFQQAGDFDAATLNRELDLFAQMVQRVDRDAQKALRLRDDEQYDSSYWGPIPSRTSRAGKYLAFDATGKPIASSGSVNSVPVSTFMEGLLDDADKVAARLTLGLVLGTDVQAYNANLAALAGLTAAAGKIPYFTSGSGMGLFDLTGAILPFAGSALPTGFLTCDGSAVSRTTYANLFAKLVTDAGFSAQTFTVTIASPGVITKSSHGFLGGERVRLSTTGALPTGLSAGIDYFVNYVDANTFTLSSTLGGAVINTSGTQSGTHSYTQSLYGLGDGSTTFNLPDMRSQFARGYSPTRNLGTGQLDAFQGHYHNPLGGSSFMSSSSSGGLCQGGAGYTTYTTTGAPVTDGTNGTPRTASETRPVNVALNYCIKY